MTRTLRSILVLAVVAIVACGAIVLWALQAQSSDFAFVPRAAQPTLGAVKLEGEKTPAPGSGRLYFTTVGVRHATVWETWFGVGDGGQLVPEHAVQPAGESDEERARLDTEAMGSSQDAAEVVGLRALGYRVTVTSTGVQIAGIDPGAPIANDGAQLGDLILRAQAKRITTIDSLREVLATVGAEHRVALGLHRDGKLVTIDTETIEGQDDRPILGILPAQASRVTSSRKVTYSVEGVGGPSAGLAFALQIYSAGKDYANLHGRRVAATGTLSMVGTVGPIGGVGEKAIGARRAGAELFLVPKANAAEARKVNVEGLKIVPVENFTEALHVLAAMPQP
jgi:PDZ domain-containing protein